MYFLRFLVVSGGKVNLVPFILSCVKIETHMSFKNLSEEKNGRVMKSKSLSFQKKKKNQWTKKLLKIDWINTLGTLETNQKLAKTRGFLLKKTQLDLNKYIAFCDILNLPDPIPYSPAQLYPWK